MVLRLLKVAVGVALCSLPLFGQSREWVLQNPIPTGNWLNDIFFLSASKGWAVGINGTLISTADSGHTWNSISTPKNNVLRSISFQDSLRGWIVGGVFGRSYILKTINGGNSWFEDRLDLAEGYLSKVLFTSPTKGWITAARRDLNLYVTEDGGETWVPRNVSNSNLHDVFFLNTDTGYVCGDLGFIGRTTDGGKSWKKSTVPRSGGVFLKIIMMTREIGYSISSDASGGTVFKTADGGDSWEIIASTSPVEEMYFKTADSGFVFPHASATTVLATADGGTNWSAKLMPGMQKIQKIIYSSSSNLFFAVCWNGSIFRSRNPEIGFEEISRGTGSTIYALGFADQQHGFGFESDGTFILTSTGGRVWKKAGSLGRPVPQGAWIKAFTPLHAVVAGSGGIYSVTSDGGKTWQSDSGPLLKAVDGRFENTLSALAISSRDTSLVKTLNGGRTWFSAGSKIPPPTRYDLVSGTFFSPESGFVARRRVSVYKTTDGGEQWSGCSPIDSSIVIYDAAFPSLDTGWIVGAIVPVSGEAHPRILKTVDRCASWREQSDLRFQPDFARPDDGRPQTTIVRKIRAINGRKAWALSDRGVLHTSDGGTVWAQEVLPQHGILRTVLDLVDSANIWVAGNASFIWKYSSDGTGLLPRKADKIHSHQVFWVLDKRGIPRLIQEAKVYDLQGRRIRTLSLPSN